MSRYRIASLKHTSSAHEHITWWGLDHCGYTPVLGDRCGEYSAEEAAKLNTGGDYIAVPVEVVRALSTPEPYWKPGDRFYDQRGPVVDNTRANWNQLIKASMTDGRRDKPKPAPFRGTRRSFAWAPPPPPQPVEPTP